MSPATRIGVVGLGNMGWPIADCLVAEGRLLLVGDARRELRDSFRADHPMSEDIDSRWDELDTLVLVLPDSNIVESVVSEAIERLKDGALVIDMSSSDPARSRVLAQRLHERGCRFVDAPVSGGVAAARERRLAVLLGGADSDVREAQELLSPLAKSLIHVGGVGAGHAAKALNNLVSAGGLSLTAEALHAAEHFGITPETMLAVLNGSSGRTNTSENKVAQFMFSGTYASGFSQHLMTKDIAIAAGLIRASGLSTTVSESVREQWAVAAKSVEPTADHTQMHRLIVGMKGDASDT